MIWERLHYRGSIYALSLVLARVLGALFGLLSAFLAISFFGKTLAADYFVFFALSYFFGQIYRFAGEINILTSVVDMEGDCSASLLSFYLFLFSILILLLIQLLSCNDLGNDWILLAFVAGLQFCFVEQVGDYLKRKGANFLGIIFSSSLVHVVFSCVLFIGVNDIHLSLIFSLSIVIFIGTILVALLLGNMRVKRSKICITRAELLAFFYNISSQVASPLFLYWMIYLFGKDIGTDFRISMRVSTIVYFVFQAVQQLALRKFRCGSWKSYEILRLKVLGIFLPSAAVMSLGVMFIMFAGSSLGYVTGDMLPISAILVTTFWCSGFFISNTIFCVANRNFSVIFWGRVFSLIFVGWTLAMIQVFGVQNSHFGIYLCVATIGFFYVLQHIFGSILIKLKENTFGKCFGEN